MIASRQLGNVNLPQVGIYHRPLPSLLRRLRATSDSVNFLEPSFSLQCDELPSYAMLTLSSFLLSRVAIRHYSYPHFLLAKYERDLRLTNKYNTTSLIQPPRNGRDTSRDTTDTGERERASVSVSRLHTSTEIRLVTA